MCLYVHTYIHVGQRAKKGGDHAIHEFKDYSNLETKHEFEVRLTRNSSLKHVSMYVHVSVFVILCCTLCLRIREWVRVMHLLHLYTHFGKDMCIRSI